MAGDPLEYVNPGDPLSQVQAATWNEFIDSCRRSKMRPLRGDIHRGIGHRHSCLIKVRNTTGGTLAQESVVIFDVPTVLPTNNEGEFLRDLCMDVIAPGTPSDDAVIAILAEPLVNNAIGLAYTVPLAQVKVVVSGGETAWKWAEISSTVTANMVMSESPASARIVWKESGTGTKWAVVAPIVQFSGGTSGRWAIAQSDFEKETSPTAHHVVAQTCNKDGTSPSGSDITVYFENNPTRYPNVEEDDVFQIVWNDAKSEWMAPQQDEPVGTIKLIDAGVSIPHGWQNLTTSYPNADGRFILCDATGDASYEGTQDSHSPDYSITVYPLIGGTTPYETTPNAGAGLTCIYTLKMNAPSSPTTTAGTSTAITGTNSTDLDRVKRCAAVEQIPPYTITDARPPWIKFRYIIRIDNGT
jgi:hypothetical protein